MNKFMRLIFVILLLSSEIYAQESSYSVTQKELIGHQVKIGLKNGTIPEAQAKEQLKTLLQKHPIGNWIFSDTVLIDQHSIPHSHPVLTLNTKYLSDDAAQLATFLHEQFHWAVSADKHQLDEAIKRYEKEYPSIPETLPMGARDKYSSYLHLVVCDLEYQAMTELLGEFHAREILKKWKHYTWIYDKVLNDKIVRRINLEFGFSIEKYGKWGD